MIPVQRLARRRRAWERRAEKEGRAPLPRPAGNLVNHIAQLQAPATTVFAGAADPLLWLALVAGHEAALRAYVVTAVVAGPRVERQLREVIARWELRGELRYMLSPPAGECSLAVVDLRVMDDRAVLADLRGRSALLVLYGVAAAGETAAWIAARGWNHCRIPYGDEFIVAGESLPVTG